MPLARNWTACSGVLFNCFQCSGLLCSIFVFFVQLRLCNQRLLRSLCSQRRSSTVAKRQTRRLSFFTQKWLNSACAIKDCFVRFAHNGGGVRFHKRPPAHRRRAFAHTPYGTRMFAKVRRTNLLLILVHLHPTLFSGIR